MYAVVALLEKRKHSQDRLSGRVEASEREEVQASINSFEEGIELSSEQQDLRKKTMKSLIFKESMLGHDYMSEKESCEELEVSQVYYGDRVMIVRGGNDDLRDRLVVYNALRVPKAQRLHYLKNQCTNI